MQVNETNTVNTEETEYTPLIVKNFAVTGVLMQARILREAAVFPIRPT